MTDDHELIVFTEPPLVGRTDNLAAWQGYVDSFPRYVIYPQRLTEPAPGLVAVLGHTTGSDLGLLDDEEAAMTLIWLAEVQGGLVRLWRLIEDSEEHRRLTGLGGA
jgi:hypothetical protein